MPRRDPFERLKRPVQSSPSPPSPSAAGEQPPTVLDMINQMGRKKRNRDWEKRHPTRSYWVPRHLHERARKVREQVTALGKHLAKQYGEAVPYSADEVAQVLIEYALDQVARGRIALKARPDPQANRLRLTWEETQAGWPQEIPEVKKQRSSSSKGLFLGYRWGEEYHKTILNLSDKHNLARGEVVLYLLEQAITAYETGRLRLTTAPAAVEQKVDGRWSS